MKIETAGRDLRGAWADYVDSHPEAAAFHLPQWEDVLAESFRVTPLNLAAIDGDGGIRGVLPLYFSRSFLSGPCLCSLANGLLADNPHIGALLIQRAMEERDRRRGRYLLMRMEDDPGSPTAQTTRSVRTVIPVDRPAEEAWAAVKAKTRWGVNFARKNGVEIVETEDAGAAIGEFYTCYARNMRDLGTPVMTPRYMEAMARHLGDRMRVLLARHAGRAIGGMIVVRNRTLWSDLYASIVRECQPLYANYLLYWRAIELACEAEGVERFDLGRSVIDSGNHGFKRKWRGEDIYFADRYYFAPGAANRLAVAELREGRGLKQRVWSRLPLAAANRLGPILRRALPFA